MLTVFSSGHVQAAYAVIKHPGMPVHAASSISASVFPAHPLCRDCRLWLWQTRSQPHRLHRRLLSTMSSGYLTQMTTLHEPTWQVSSSCDPCRHHCGAKNHLYTLPFFCWVLR